MGLHIKACPLTALVAMILMGTVPFPAIGGQPRLLIVGDSISSAMGEEDIGKCHVTNVARGGTGVRQNLDAVRAVGPGFDAAIIALGINDARRVDPPFQDPLAWSRKFDELLALTRERAKVVYVSTILPIERRKTPFGDYAKTSQIERFNRLIHAAAKRNRVVLVDTNAFVKSYSRDFTQDGVHPAPEGTRALIQFWASALDVCRK